MKTIKISIIFALAALLFASCANDASDSNTADSNAQNNSQSAVEYTLSFDVNVPEDTDEYYWSVGIRYTDEISGSTTYQFLTLKGTGVSSLDCDHQITNLSSARFTMKGYLAFGMPSETTWKKQ